MRDARRVLFVLVVLVCGAIDTGSAVAQVVQIKPEALTQIAVLQQEKASRTPTQQKIDSNLLLAVKQQRDDPLFQALPKIRPRADVAGVFGDGHLDRNTLPPLARERAEREVAGVAEL